MGHLRLGDLPKSRKWNQVVDELRLGADVEAVAAAATDAAERALDAASADPAFLHSFWLLTQIPLAAWGQTLPTICPASACRCQSIPASWT